MARPDPPMRDKQYRGRSEPKERSRIDYTREWRKNVSNSYGTGRTPKRDVGEGCPQGGSKSSLHGGDMD